MYPPQHNNTTLSQALQHRRPSKQQQQQQQINYDDDQAIVDSHDNTDSVDSPPPTDAKKKRKRLSVHDRSNSHPEIDSILSQKRKPREKTACLPCRKRKVGCDRLQPCKTCVERRHPEVCIYESTDAPTLAYNGQSYVSSTENITVPREYLDHLMMRVEGLENSMREMTSDIRSMLSATRTKTNVSQASLPKSPVLEASSRDRVSESEEQHRTREGVHTNNPVTGQVVHVGGNSVPALLMALMKNKENGTAEDRTDWAELANGSILPLLGLHNESATYPFVDLWSTPEGVLTKIKRIADVLPSEEDCRTFFTAYVTISQAVFPGIADIKEFEESLWRFYLRKSGEPVENAITEQTIYGKPMPWVALLFAVLASGCHFSEVMDRPRRELTSKVFVCCSFECLRLSNFLSNPDLTTIQAMSVFLNVLLNLYQAGAVWGMLGLTIRLAQSLGLHHRDPPSTTVALRNRRAQIWWSVMWQDSLVSITYDRAGTAMSLDGPLNLPPEYDDPPGHWRYERCMYKLCTISLNIVRERHAEHDQALVLKKMNGHEREIDDMMVNATDTIRDWDACKEWKDQGQHLIFKLHKSYILSEICRPALSPSAPNTDLARRMRQTCVDSLAGVVEGWIGLYEKIAKLTYRSWPATHRALSSALLLMILRMPAHMPLLAEFTRVLEECTAELAKDDVPPPIQRSIFWLRKLTISGEHSTSSSPAIPTLASGDSPYAIMDKMMWQKTGTP